MTSWNGPDETETASSPVRPDHAAPRDPGPLALSPVAVAWACGLLADLLAAFGLHLTAVQTGAVSVIAAAAIGVVTAITARPWYIPGITGAAAAALSAAAAFGLHWTAGQVGAATSALSLVLMLLTHQSVIPAAAARTGMTATDIWLAQHAEHNRRAVQLAASEGPGGGQHRGLAHRPPESGRGGSVPPLR